MFVNKASNLTQTQIKERLEKNTKTSYTKQANKYSEVLKEIKNKFFNLVQDSPPLCKPLISLVAHQKRRYSYEENRQKALKRVEKVLKQNKKYTYKVNF